MKKLAALVIALTMCLMIPTQIIAARPTYTMGEYVIEVLTDTPEYAKTKLINTETGEVEWLEEFRDNGWTYRFEATAKGETVVIDNPRPMPLTDIADLHIVGTSPFGANAGILASGWSAWSPEVTGYSNSVIQGASTSALMALSQIIIGNYNAKALIASLAEFLISLSQPTIWYKYIYKTRTNASTMQLQTNRRSFVYLNNSYTNPAKNYNETWTEYIMN